MNGNSGGQPERYDVHISEGAEADIDEVFHYGFARDPHLAVEWHSGSTDTILGLREFPRRFAVADESADAGFEIRRALYQFRGVAYHVRYTVRDIEDGGSFVRILRMRHAARGDAD